jgi:hypothetical protein
MWISKIDKQQNVSSVKNTEKKSLYQVELFTKIMSCMLGISAQVSGLPTWDTSWPN